jgi:hypothetical protein
MLRRMCGTRPTPCWGRPISSARRVGPRLPGAAAGRPSLGPLSRPWPLKGRTVRGRAHNGRRCSRRWATTDGTGRTCATTSTWRMAGRLGGRGGSGVSAPGERSHRAVGDALDQRWRPRGARSASGADQWPLGGILAVSSAPAPSAAVRPVRLRAGIGRSVSAGVGSMINWLSTDFGHTQIIRRSHGPATSLIFAPSFS